MKRHLLFLFLSSFLACNAPEKPKNTEFVQNDMPKQHVQPEITAEMVVNRKYFVQTKSKKYDIVLKITNYDTSTALAQGAAILLNKKNHNDTIQKIGFQFKYYTPDTVLHKPKYDLSNEGIILVDDYDFDGQEDIAIEPMDFEGGEYDYGIYLWDKKTKVFKENKLFSFLQRSFKQGFVYYMNPKKKLLTGMSRSSCSLYHYEQYKVIRHKPVKVNDILMDFEFDNTVTVKKRLGRAWKIKKYVLNKDSTFDMDNYAPYSY